MPLFETYPGSAAANVLAFTDTAERLSRSVPESIRLGIALRNQRLQEEQAAEVVRRQRAAELAAAVGPLGSTGGEPPGSVPSPGRAGGAMGVGGAMAPSEPTLEDMDRFNRMVADLDRTMGEKWAVGEAAPTRRTFVAPEGAQMELEAPTSPSPGWAEPGLSVLLQPSPRAVPPGYTSGWDRVEAAPLGGPRYGEQPPTRRMGESEAATFMRPSASVPAPRPTLHIEPGPVSPMWAGGVSGRVSPEQAAGILTNPTMSRLFGRMPQKDLATMLAEQAGYSDLLGGQFADETARLRGEYAVQQRRLAEAEAMTALALDPTMRDKSPEEMRRIAAAQLDMPEAVQAGAKRTQERAVEGIKVGPEHRKLTQEDRARAATEKYRVNQLLDEADARFQIETERIDGSLAQTTDPAMMEQLTSERARVLDTYQRALMEAPLRAASEAMDVGTRTQLGPAASSRAELAAARAEQIRAIQAMPRRTPEEVAEWAGRVYDASQGEPAGRAPFIELAKTPEGQRKIEQAAARLARGDSADASDALRSIIFGGGVLSSAPTAPTDQPPDPGAYVRAMQAGGWAWNGTSGMWEKPGQPSSTDEEARRGFERQQAAGR